MWSPRLRDILRQSVLRGQYHDSGLVRGRRMADPSCKRPSQLLGVLSELLELAGELAVVGLTLNALPSFIKGCASTHNLHQGYVRVVYTDPTRQAANMSVFTLTKGAAALSYSFNGTQSSVAWTMYCSLAYAAAAPPGACTPASGPVWVNVSNSLDGSLLVLDETHFIWTNAPLPPLQGDYRAGQKGSIVELFGWPYPDIAEECALLAQYGYLGFKVRRGWGRGLE